MNFNFKKVASLVASAAMMGSTIGIAAAASYPNPFVSGASSDVAVVVGANAASSDFTAATDIGANLNQAVASGAIVGGDVTVDGEAYPLFTSSSPLELNKSIGSVRGSVSEVNLPAVLSEQTFSGDVDAKATFRIYPGSDPRVIFAKQPTSSDDPVTGIKLSTTQANYLYNATINFNKAVNFSNSKSEGKSINLFGQDFTVGSATDDDDIILLKESYKVSFSSDGSMVETVEVDGEEYTIELMGATDSTATIRITDSSGESDFSELDENDSETINGVEVAVTYANEDTALNKLQAEVIVGTSKMTLTNGNEVKVGKDDDVVEGTYVDLHNDYTGNITKITIQVYAADGDTDSITPGNAFLDPVFGSFKVDFPGLTIGDSSDDRENIEVKASGNDKMTVSFTNWQGKELSNFDWLNNESGKGKAFLGDSSEWKIFTYEMAKINKSAYAVVGNEDEGYIVKLQTLTNTTTGFDSDAVRFQNAFDTTQTWDAIIDSEGAGTISIGGKEYTVSYVDPKDGTEGAYVKLNYPDSSSNDMIVYPTIQTSKGAKLFFYEPLTISLDDWNGDGGDATGLKLPDGDGYSTITIGGIGADANGTAFNVTFPGGSALQVDSGDNLATGEVSSSSGTIGQLTYNVTSDSANTTKIYLLDPADGSTKVTNPAIVLFEEQDESNNYEATIINTGGGGDSNNGVGVTDVMFTWNKDADMEGSAYNAGLQRESDDDFYDKMDQWGTLSTIDQSTSDQYTVTISYPDTQVFGQVYVADATASLSTGGKTNVVPVYDNETGKFSGKNLIVIGGSCINSVSADLLGSPLCGADFTSETGVDSGEYLIETFSRSGGKIATLVAGYNAADTTNAAKALTTNTITTDVGAKYTGTTASDISKV